MTEFYDPIDYHDALEDGPNQVPIGTILPVMPDRVPEGFLVWEGQTIHRDDFPELFSVLDWVYDAIYKLFEGWGGSFDGDTITFPDLTDEQIRKMAGFGHYGDSLVVAQKAFRPDRNS